MMKIAQNRTQAKQMSRPNDQNGNPSMLSRCDHNHFFMPVEANLVC